MFKRDIDNQARFLTLFRSHLEDYIKRMQGANPRVTRASVADRLGCDRTTLYKYLDGTTKIPKPTLEAFCTLIGLNHGDTNQLFDLAGFAALYPANPPAIARAQVTLLLEGHYHNFDQQRRQHILSVLAEALELPSDQIRLLSVSAGSIRLQIEIPSDAVAKLQALHQNKDPRLQSIGLTAIVPNEQQDDADTPELSSIQAPSRGRQHNLDIGGNAQIGLAIAGDVHGPITINNQATSTRPSIDQNAAEALLATLPLDNVPAHAPLPAGSRMPLGRNPLFVGREDDLKAIAKALHGGATAAIGQVAAVTGLGGIGKTNLATEFVHRYGAYFAGGVFWLSFAESTTIPAEVVACGGPGGLNLPGFDTLKVEDQLARVRREWQSPIPRLLVFDNCEDERLIGQWRPVTGGCRVLITSQRQQWSTTLGIISLALDILPRAESIALLHKHRPDLPSGDPALGEIALALGDLPLALHLAGSFLEAFHADQMLGDPSRFLEELRSQPILEHEALRGIDTTFSPTNHLLHVRRTFAISYDRLKPAEPVDAIARELLARAACMAPGEPIPRELLFASIELPDATARRCASRAIGRLVALGLLDAERDADVRLHRLLATFVGSIGADESAQDAVERTLVALAHQANDEEILNPLLPQAHLRFICDKALERQDERAADMAFELDRYLSLAGDYRGALGYEEQALAIRQRLLPSIHPKQAQSLNSRAILLHHLGQSKEARRDWEDAIDILAHLPDERLLRADAHGNLGLQLMYSGDLDAAWPHIQEGLAIRTQELGENHKLTAGSYSDLATWHFFHDEFTQARDLYQTSLKILLSSVGPKHRYTAQTRQNLGEAHLALKEYATARSLFEEALAVREELLPAEHPDIAYTLHYLAECCYIQGETLRACQNMRRACQIRTEMLGADHPDTQDSCAKLTEWACPDEA